MRWRGRRQSTHIEYRRGRRVPRVVSIGGFGGGGLMLILLLAVVCGVDPSQLLQDAGDASLPAAYDLDRPAPAISDERAQFVGVVLADTEEVWGALFAREGQRYEEPTLVLFSGAVRSACGQALTASGPFYCPGDHKVYIDLRFYDELVQHFHATGDFAQAYVIAHEIGHHVQTLLGISQKVHALRGRVSKNDYNRASVRLELQADCLAGIWAHHAQRSLQSLEPGDIEEALEAASAIGDDAIQRRNQGYVVPDAFTHGSSKERMHWFRRGVESGDLRVCDTFG